VIEVENYRTEYPPEHITGIAESIAQSGYKREFAITVYPIEVYSILDRQQCYAINTGHCRARAARQAGLTVIPAIIKPNDPITLALDQVGENGNRRDPNDIDTAKGYKRTLDTGATIEQLSKAVGKNRPYIEKSEWRC
jgi:ParB family chromosome partitioning protein